MATFTLTCIGDDRPGLVSDLSAHLHAHGASWNRSQMARLAGKFAGILLLDVPDARADELVGDVAGLEAVGLQVTLARTDAPSGEPALLVDLALLGDDRPGIVAEISAALARERVSIRDLATDVREAPMAGGHLFEVRALLEAPQGTRVDDLRATLEAIADELMVEITLSETADVPV
jgi:glycine cleavage system regulatory protein